MEEAVVDVDYEALQHFISSSMWDHRAVMDRVAQEADNLIGGTGQTALILDETAIAKKGKASVGVARDGWERPIIPGRGSRCAIRRRPIHVSRHGIVGSSGFASQGLKKVDNLVFLIENREVYQGGLPSCPQAYYITPSESEGISIKRRISLVEK